MKLGPIYENALYEAGVRYYLNHAYEDAYDCLIDTPILLDEFYRTIFSAMGCIFVLKTQKGIYDRRAEAFRCFEKAYRIVSERQKNIIDPFNDSIAMYDMAFAYLEGIGTEKNPEKGLKILRDIDRMLSESGGSMSDVDDTFGIVEKYYTSDLKSNS